MSETPQASSLLATLPIRKRKGKHVVYVGTLPDDVQPQSPIDLPDQLGDVRILERPLTLAQAIALLRFFNRQQLATDAPNRLWAVIGFGVKHGGPEQ